MLMEADWIIPRALPLASRSFFLFGPRGTGKSTWLRHVLPNEPRIDLLDSSLYLELPAIPIAWRPWSDPARRIRG